MSTPCRSLLAALAALLLLPTTGALADRAPRVVEDLGVRCYDTEP